jgi:plasmid stabilization system protein ParE
VLIVRPEAEADIAESYRWYEAKSVGLGAAFMSEVKLKLDRIEGRPKSHPRLFGDFRRAICRRFPYAIYFSERDRRIIVFAVLHQRRNPAVWLDRI